MHNYTFRLSIKRWFSVVGMTILFVAGSTVVGIGQRPALADNPCSLSAVSAGDYVTSVSLPNSGKYTVWAHIKVPSSSASTLLLGINGTCYPMGNSSSIPVNTWTWIDYYGNSANAVQRPFLQGTQNVTMIGASLGVKVDKIEFLPGACIPTGDGSNCIVGSQASGNPADGGAAIAVSTAPNDSGDIVVSGDGGTIVTANTSIPTEVLAPYVTLQPNVYGSASNPIVEVDYFLSGKWLATVSSAPYSYQLNVRHILNGTYTLTTKVTYKSSKAATMSQELIVKNPNSPMQIMLAAEHYVIYEIAAIVLFVIVITVLRKIRRPKQKQ